MPASASPHRRPRAAVRLAAACALTAAGALTAACAGVTVSSGGPADAPRRASGVAAGVPRLYDDQRQVERYLSSGAYDADVAQVVGEARAWLEKRAPTAARPAVVLDVDETALSNWPAYRLNGWGRVVNGPCDLERGPCGLRAWQALGRSAALLPTLGLAQRARALGVAVFFVSARPAALRDATERNLREQGYPVTDVVVLPEGAAPFASAADFKTPARRAIERRGYTIVLSLGDQASDLAGGHAERTFKLPNPVYFLP